MGCMVYVARDTHQVICRWPGSALSQYTDSTCRYLIWCSSSSVEQSDTNWLSMLLPVMPCGAVWVIRPCSSLAITLDNFTVSCTALTAGICLPVGLCKRLPMAFEFPTLMWAYNTFQRSTFPIRAISPPISLCMDHPVTQAWSPASLKPCLISHWQSYGHQARTV